MDLEIRRLTAEEIPRHTHIVRYAFYLSNDVNNKIMYPRGMTPAYMEYVTDKTVKMHAESNPEHQIWLGAFPKDPNGAKEQDTQGKNMLATAYWKLEGPHTYKPELDTWDADAPVELDSNGEVLHPQSGAPDTNNAGVAWFFNKIDNTRQRYMGSQETYWHLALLCASHEHQRSGAGTAMLKQGLERVDAEGMRCWIDSTEIGRPLYERYGFRVLEPYALDAARFGDDSGRIGYTYAMVREVGGAAPTSNSNSN